MRAIIGAKPQHAEEADSGTHVQATDFVARVSFRVDFEGGTNKKLWRKLLNREADRLGGACKSLVPDRLTPGFQASSTVT